MRISSLKTNGIKKENFGVVMGALLLIIYNGFLWILLSNIVTELSDSIIVIVVFSIIPSYGFMLYSTKKHMGIARFYFVFITLTIFFYFGQHLLVILDKSYLLSQNHTILDGRIKDQSIINASYLILQSLLLIHIGYFYSIKYKKNAIDLKTDQLKRSDIDKKVYKSFKFIAWTLFFISAVAMIIKLSYLIQLNQLYGYLERRAIESSDEFTSGLGNFALYLSEWFFPSIYMLFIFNTQKFKNKSMYLIIGAFSVLYLMSGSRFLLLKLGMGIFLIQYIWIKPLTKKSTITIIVLGVIGVVVLKIISLARAIPNVGFSSMSMILSELFSQGLFSGILWETGITFTSISNIIDKAPSVIPLFYGKSYLGSILIFLPSFMRFGFFETYNLSVSAIFSPLYYNTNFIGYGSSFIAEAYYNFGYFMLFFMMFIGVLFGKLENALYKARLTRNAPMFFLTTYILSELIYIVRNDMYPIPRYIVYYAIVPLIIFRLLNVLLQTKRSL